MSWLGFSKNEFKIKFHEAPVRKVAKKYVEWNASGKNKKIVRLLMGTPTKVLGQFSHSFEVCLSIVVLFLHIFFPLVFAATLLSVLIIILPGLSFLLCDEIFPHPVHCFSCPVESQ